MKGTDKIQATDMYDVMQFRTEGVQACSQKGWDVEVPHNRVGFSAVRGAIPGKSVRIDERTNEIVSINCCTG